MPVQEAAEVKKIRESRTARGDTKMRTEIMYEVSEFLKRKKEIPICTEMLFGVYMTCSFSIISICVLLAP